MKKVVLALVTAAFAATAVGGPVLAAKKKEGPGKCGVMKYYDKKKKACASKG